MQDLLSKITHLCQEIHDIKVKQKKIDISLPQGEELAIGTGETTDIPNQGNRKDYHAAQLSSNNSASTGTYDKDGSCQGYSLVLTGH